MVSLVENVFEEVNSLGNILGLKIYSQLIYLLRTNLLLVLNEAKNEINGALSFIEISEVNSARNIRVFFQLEKVGFIILIHLLINLRKSLFCVLSIFPKK